MPRGLPFRSHEQKVKVEILRNAPTPHLKKRGVRKQWLNCRQNPQSGRKGRKEKLEKLSGLGSNEPG